MKRIHAGAIAAVVVLMPAVAWLLLRATGDQSPVAAVAEKGDSVWTCSMHPQVRLPTPGKCPICSMPLIPAKPGSSTASTDAAAPHAMLQLSDRARAMASVETVVVERRPVLHELRTVGKVQFNEAALAVINSRVEGYVEHLYVDFTGVRVKKGDHLVDIYSPDFVMAQRELMVALEGGQGLAESAKLKLLRWGLTAAQIEDLVRQKKVTERVTLLSPINGTVIERIAVQQGMVKAGDMLYKLANLESVWVYLDLYELDLAWVQTGETVEIQAEAYPGETFTGRIWFINPVLTEETRTVKVLVNIFNADQQLKPGMFVSTIIRVPILASGKAAPSALAGQYSCVMHPQVVMPQPGQCPVCGMPLTQIPGSRAALTDAELNVLVVPTSAVLDSGVRKLVYVEHGKGEFMPMEVTLGSRAGAFYPVLAGLNQGDRVAVRGSFLLDSQSQIQGLPSLFYPQGQAPAAGHQHGTSAGAAAPSVTPAAGHEGHNTPKPAEHKH